jgi:endonuclease/exonuclease/phosphatase family metal-dependent hydrolase
LRYARAATLIAALALAVLPATAIAKGHHQHGQSQGPEEVSVMTRNLYLGADLGPAIAATTPDELSAANGQILREVVHNNFPTRAKGLAQELLAEKPDLVGLQEVARWQTTPLSPAATPIAYDYLPELLAELNKNGPRYDVVVVQEEFDLEAPADYNGLPNDGPLPGFPNAEMLGRLTMRDVILARHGAGVQTWNAEGGNFNTLLEVPILGQPKPIKRGWTETDAKVRGSHPFHFVNTHLEAFQPLIREAQAKELVAPGGPATSSLPVVLVGDLNSDDDTVSFPDTLAYEALVAAGMVERSTANPLSCCLKASELGVGDGGSVADFDHQVDHVMTNDPSDITLKDAAVTGLLPVNGFWNSDHAGLFSSLSMR